MTDVRPLPGSVRQVVEARRRQASQLAFLDASGGTRTWAQIAARIPWWEAVGEGWPGARVGLALSDPLTMATEYLAALAARVTIAPLNPSATPDELADAARVLGVCLVVSDLAGPPPDGITLADPGQAPPVSRQAPAQVPLAGGGPVALIMSSSGSTGTPKVIPLSEAQLLHAAASVVEHLELDEGERGFSPLPLWHINGLVVGVLAAAVAGSSLVVGRFSRRGFWATVEQHRPTWLNLVPAMLHVLADAAGEAPSGHRIRLARSASAPLPRATRERFEHRFAIPVVETYGMTEAASQITANPLGARRPGSVGRPAGVDVRVVDGDGRPAAAGVTGGVQIRGRSVARQYWQPAGTQPPVREALVDGGWRPTGDVGWLDSDGYLWLAGRADDVINRGGEKVQPREVEEVLAGDPRVRLAVVVGRPHPLLGQEPVAYILASEDVDPDQLASDLERRCAGALSRYKRPAAFTVLDVMPAGPTGKPRRGELRRLAAGGVRR